jgi:putative ABC transport system permease protein
VDSLRQDFRYSLHALAKAPQFALVVIVTLGIGIAANTIIFSVAGGIFLRGVPYPNANRLIHLSRGYPGGLQGGGKLSYPEFLDIERENTSFDAMAAHQAFGALALTGNGEPVRVAVSYATPSYFELLGVRAAVGRIFRPEEDHLDGAAPVVLLSYGFWQRQFGCAENVVGRTITLNQRALTVVGVLPETFHDPLAEQDTGESTNAWIPLGLSYSLTGMSNATDRLGSVLWGLALLKPGATVDGARQEVDAIGKKLEQTYPASDRGYTLVARTLRDQLLGEFYGPARLLMAGAAIILLIGCVNAGNLLLVRLISRNRELAVRSALGASPNRLARQLMTENGLLMILSGVFGAFLAIWGMQALRSWGAANLPSMILFPLDGSVLLESVAITLFAGLLFGLAPAVIVTRVDLRDALSQSGRQGGGLGRRRAPRALVAAEVGLAVVLLVAAGLLFKSFRSLVSSNLGFDTSHLLTLRLDLRAERYEEALARGQFARQLVDRLNALPGVQRAMIWGPGMLGKGGWVANLTRSDAPVDDPVATQMVSRQSINPGALHDMAIPLLRGREFTWGDNAASVPVVILSESAAKALWPNQDALGKQVRGEGALSTPMTIIGIARDARHRQRLNLIDSAIGIPPAGLGPQYDGYFPYLQRPNPSLVVAVRVSGAESSIIREVKDAVLSLDSALPIYDVAMLDDRLSGQVSTSHALTVLTGAFAVVALFLAAFGLFGVLAQAVGQRTKEIGIRMTLGAAPRNVLGMILREGMLLTGLGLVTGFILSFFVTQAMKSVLFGVKTTDAPVICGIGILMAATAALACWLPARRAMLVEPLTALRSD